MVTTRNAGNAYLLAVGIYLSLICGREIFFEVIHSASTVASHNLKSHHLIIEVGPVIAVDCQAQTVSLEQNSLRRFAFTLAE